tara:strand:+ start:116 stop:463 length:348 start_codon:yes stop_codon:yes gene_type:complete
MEHGIIDYLLDYGSLGVMAGIFFWLYLNNKKELLESRDRNFEEQEKIRSRWRTVIEKYDVEKSEMIEERINNLNDLKNAINQLKVINEEQNRLLNEAHNELRDMRTEIKIRLRGE